MTRIADSAFAFQAQTAAGEALSGTIQAASVDDANRRLRAIQLRVIELDPVRQPARGKPLRGSDFQTFNTQLAHLTTAGLPVEQSLRLIAEDMSSGRLSQSIREIAAELESGRTLPEAFEKHAGQFPPLYSQLVNAGMRTGNLSAMLLNLGRYLEMVTRLRGMLWRAISYPLMVLLSLMVVIVFLGIFVLPPYAGMYEDFHTSLPLITQIVLSFSSMLINDWPVLLSVAIILIVGLPIVWQLLRHKNRQQAAVEAILFPLPLIGPALRRNLLARWCDALKLGVEVGLDLPAAIALAGDAVGSTGLQHDGAALVSTIQSGKPLDAATRMRLLPPTIIVVISLAASNNDLPAGLKTLSIMFQQQAELKMAMIPVVLTPVLIVLIGCVVGVVVLALFAPMFSLISAVR